jgi:hypothetical protein
MARAHACCCVIRLTLSFGVDYNQTARYEFQMFTVIAYPCPAPDLPSGGGAPRRDRMAGLP